MSQRRQSDPTTPWRRAGAISGSLAAVLAVAVLIAPPVGASSPTVRTAVSPNPAVWIYQTAYITEQGNFTVSMQVTSTTGIQFVFFTFCQLSSPVCYSPVVMTLHGTDLYQGTTSRMSSYLGMTQGVHAGYNITIKYADGSNTTEPQFPNAFTNLTVATEVNGAYMFEMSVSPNLYALSGQVDDSVTGAPIVGAAVSIHGANNSTTTTGSNGAFTFAAVPNGTYTLTIAHAGYTTSTQSVSVSGQNFMQEVQLTNASAPHPSGGGGSPTPSGTLYLEYGALIVVTVGVIVGLYLVARRRKVG